GLHLETLGNRQVTRRRQAETADIDRADAADGDGVDVLAVAEDGDRVGFACLLAQGQGGVVDGGVNLDALLGERVVGQLLGGDRDWVGVDGHADYLHGGALDG